MVPQVQKTPIQTSIQAPVSTAIQVPIPIPVPVSVSFPSLIPAAFLPAATPTSSGSSAPAATAPRASRPIGRLVTTPRKATSLPIVRLASAGPAITTAIRPVARRPSAGRALAIALPYEVDVRRRADGPSGATRQGPQAGHGRHAAIGRLGQETTHAVVVRGRPATVGAPSLQATGRPQVGRQLVRRQAVAATPVTAATKTLALA